MNVANLQIQGMLAAIAAVTELFVAKGLLTREEIDTALASAEQGLLGEERMAADIEPSGRDAITFPVRWLHLANTMAARGGTPTFMELARKVGETKGKYNDQA
ncbi:MAG TPA: hypothetical protein VLZ53_02515 [Devosia sp.]|jgi:hypothetical protein|nr:hypothetical protein [Devosia sp.]